MFQNKLVINIMVRVVVVVHISVYMFLKTS